jgi:hypothetical protein
MAGLVAGFLVVVAILLLADRAQGGPYAILVALLVCVLAVVMAVVDGERR